MSDLGKAVILLSMLIIALDFGDMTKSPWWERISAMIFMTVVWSLLTWSWI